MKRGFKKMSTRYWYGKSIQSTQKVITAFFDFMELESAQTFLADIITYADAPEKYQPEDAANHLMKYYAFNDLLSACYNLLKDEALLLQLNNVLIKGMDATSAIKLKTTAKASLIATFKMYPLKKWRYNLCDILNYALSSYTDKMELNLTAIYIQLKATLEAVAFINNCFKENR